MIRVAIFSNTVNPTTGWGNMTYELCREFDMREDVEFQLHLPVEYPVDSATPFESRIHRTLPRWRPTYRRWPLELRHVLFPRFDLHGVDIIHAVAEFPYGIVAQRLGQRVKTPWVISLQGTFAVTPLLSLVDRWWYKPALKNAARITVPSRFTGTAMQQLAGLRHEATVIHNPVNYNRFQEPSDVGGMRAKLGLSDKARVILSVGWLKTRKGFDVLIKAFSRVAQKESDTHLVIVGEGSQVFLQELASSLDIGEKVHLVGVVPGDDLISLFQLCEVFALLPRNERWNFEGFGIVFLEAAACGKPVVATRSGGVPDAVLDGETGFLVDEDDYKAAADAILRLLRETELAVTMGEAGREYAAKHTWSWYADQMVDVYKEAVTTQRRSD